MADWPERLNRFIDALQDGKRPERDIASTPEEVEELRLAARLAGARPDVVNPDPAFLASLRRRLNLADRAAEPRVSRGGLLRVAGLWVAGVACGVGLDWTVRRLRPALANVAPAAPPDKPDIDTAGGKWFPVAAFSEIPDKAVLAFDAGAVPAVVVREGDTVRAMSRVCTHMACLLQYNPSWRALNCPCHGASFDLNGRPDTGYESANNLPPLPSIDVRVVNGTVYVLGA